MLDEEDECDTGAPCLGITVEELSYARDLVNREPFSDQERLDNWLRIMDEVVGAIGYAYRSSF
jgi:hypothetical protein